MNKQKFSFSLPSRTKIDFRYLCFFFISIMMHHLYPIWTPPRGKKLTATTTRRTLNLSTSILTTTSQVTHLTKTTLFTSSSSSSSMILSTMKSNRNRIFLPLSISLISIILCISFSYCICLYLKHYLLVKGNIQSNVMTINRPSIVASIYSTNSSWYTYDIEGEENIDRITITERRPSTDSVELFRY